MAKRTLHRLSALAVATITKPGRHGDGGNLYLVVDPSGARRWTFLYRERGTGKHHEIGLGSFLNVSLAAARQKAADLRRLIGEKKDPKAAKVAAMARSRLFRDVADEFIEEHMGRGERNAKHVGQWRMTLTDYCALIRDKPISEITVDDVLAVLTQKAIGDRDFGGPLWTKRHETAKRLRGRIEAVLDYASAKKMRSGDNPAKLQGALKGALKGLPESKPRGHHAAMAYADVPAFMAELRARPAIAARALEFAILTAARTGEVIGATWNEIDFYKELWTIPAARMKAKAEHRVPLSARSLAILAEMRDGREKPQGFVFPGQQRDAPLSQMALLMLLRRMNSAATAHGFRSSFRDWAGDRTSVPRDVAEGALAHKISDKVEAAYRRGTALEKRRQLMDRWAHYCESEGTGKVVPLRA